MNKSHQNPRTGKAEDLQAGNRNGREKAAAPVQSTPTKGSDNPVPNVGTSGLDPQGQFRIGDRITLAVRGGDLLLRQSHSGREVTVSEATLEGLLEDEFFTEDGDAKRLENKQG